MILMSEAVEPFVLDRFFPHHDAPERTGSRNL